MRRLLALAALVLTFAAAGCTAGSGTPQTTGSSTHQHVMGSPDANEPYIPPADAPDDVKAVCTAVNTATTGNINGLLTDLGTMISATAANDKPAADKAKTAAQAKLNTIAAELRAQMSRTSRQDLKSALEAIAKDFDRMAQNVEHIDETTFFGYGADLDKFCG